MFSQTFNCFVTLDDDMAFKKQSSSKVRGTYIV